MIRQTSFRIRRCREGNDDPRLDIGFTLDRWIRETPGIRDAIVWRPDGDRTLRYRDWSREDRERLVTFFNELEGRGTVDLPVEPAISDFRYNEDLNPEGEHKVSSVSYEFDIARDTFFAHVAQSLRIEIRRLVPWSVRDYTNFELALLFDSIHMYEWDSTQRRHVLFPLLGKATPGDPGRVFDWLRTNTILQENSADTILAFLEWCRRLYHDYGLLDEFKVPDVYPGSRRANEAHWQYEGYQPVERTLNGTHRLTDATPHNWTHGCQGTTGLLRNVLRTINIPVIREDGCTHAIPHFVHEHWFLSHGDDPYGLQMKQWTPPISMSEIVLSDARLGHFFDNCDHVGKGVTEGIVRLLPDQLLSMHCADIAAGRPRSAGQVFLLLRRHFTMEDLNRMSFWERLEAEIDRRGGCDSL